MKKMSIRKYLLGVNTESTFLATIFSLARQNLTQHVHWTP
jgi:hypothetical protein